MRFINPKIEFAFKKIFGGKDFSPHQTQRTEVRTIEPIDDSTICLKEDFIKRVNCV